jgi:hypothetical protein
MTTGDDHDVDGEAIRKYEHWALFSPWLKDRIRNRIKRRKNKSTELHFQWTAETEAEMAREKELERAEIKRWNNGGSAQAPHSVT